MGSGPNGGITMDRGYKTGNLYAEHGKRVCAITHWDDVRILPSLPSDHQSRSSKAFDNVASGPTDTGIVWATPDAFTILTMKTHALMIQTAGSFDALPM